MNEYLKESLILGDSLEIFFDSIMYSNIQMSKTNLVEYENVTNKS